MLGRQERPYDGPTARVSFCGAGGVKEALVPSEHPYWAWRAGEEEARWLSAGELSGDRLLLRGGVWAEVADVALQAATLSVYNLTVEGLHTYAVGASGVLVHNGKKMESGESTGGIQGRSPRKA